MQLGIDLGGTKTKYGLVEDGAVLWHDSVDTPREFGYAAVVQSIADKAVALLSEHPQIVTVGVGSPGVINTGEGLVCYSNNFGWTNKPLKKDLEAALKTQVHIANDASCAALGEALYGAGKGRDRVAMLTIGTGVGGGFVCGGKLDSGQFGNMAYIFGHMVVQPKGESCNCGRNGCLEAYASASAIARDGSRLLGRKVSAQEVFEAARDGDKNAAIALDSFQRYLAQGVVDIANILRPELIVIGGGVSGSCDLFLPQVNVRLEEDVYGYKYAPVKAVQAKLGNLAGLVGAASLGNM